MNRRSVLRALLAALFGWPDDGFAASEPISVIVFKRSKVPGVDRNELRQIFQTNKTAWSQTGDRATPINLPDKSPIRHDFDRAVLGLDPDRVARYWVDRKIRGDARPPRTAPNPAAVVRAVANNPELVGYVPASDVGNEVKVIARIVDGKLQGA
jgi:ABC-type phosphate transport system substrate-binding protein